MDWNEVLKDIVSGTILLAIGGIGGWFGGVIKGKKQSSMAVERKNVFRLFYKVWKKISLQIPERYLG